MADRNTDLLEAFRTQTEEKRLDEPKALSSGIVQPAVGKRKKAKNALIKIYVNGALLLISAALVFVAYRLAVLPEIFPPEVVANKEGSTNTASMTGADFQGAGNFANNFAYNWLTGDTKRAFAYGAVGYKFPENVITPKPQVVKWNLVWNVTPKSDKEVHVVIQAGVKATEKDPERSVYLFVPVVKQEGKYGVAGVPTFLPYPGRATFTEPQSQELQMTQTDTEMINQTVNLFFTEYYGGNAEKTGIYFADQKKRNVLQNGQLNEMQEVKLYEVQKGKTNKVLADVTASVKVDDIPMIQKFKLYMTKNSNRWYIEKTEPNIPLYVP